MDNLLSVVLWLPTVAAVVLAFLPKRAIGAAKGLGLAAAIVTFLLSLGIVSGFEVGNPGFQLVENVPWIDTFGIRYSLGVDGISLWLVMLTTLLTPVVLLSTWKSIDRHVKAYVIAMLVLETGMLGAFFATDLILFYVFFEIMLVPMYLIIGVWGGKNRIYAAVKFFIFTIAGSLLMLLGIIYLAYLGSVQLGGFTFNIQELYGLAIPTRAQGFLFFAFTLAFAIKVPVFPFHTWLPDAHVEAPTGGSIILAGVLLKLGTYGFIRFVLPFFPEATREWAWLLCVLAVIGIIYGALVAWVQPDMKKLVAYSSVSHLGFCVLGIFALQQTAVAGSILQMINHGLSTGALFLLVGVIYEKRHTRMMEDFGGIARVMPIYTVLMIIAVMSSVGLPGLNGFIGEFMILAGSFQTVPVYATIAAIGVILAAIYLLWMVQRVFFGPITVEENHALTDIRWHEVAAVLPLIIFILWIGVRPGDFLQSIEPSVQLLMQTISPESGGGSIQLAAGVDGATR